MDVDLSLEGPATRVSRWQAVVKLKHDGNFYLHNQVIVMLDICETVC